MLDYSNRTRTSISILASATDRTETHFIRKQELSNIFDRQLFLVIGSEKYIKAHHTKEVQRAYGLEEEKQTYFLII